MGDHLRQRVGQADVWIMCVCTGDWATRLQVGNWNCLYHGEDDQQSGRARQRRQAEPKPRRTEAGPGMKLEDRMDTLIWQLSARSDGICEGARDSGAMDTASL